MGKKEYTSNRQYTDEFKIEAVRLAASIGGNPAAKRLGIPQSTVTNWVRRSKAGTLGEPGAAPVKRPVSELEIENTRLRRELANAKLDLEIVKKAGGVFRKGIAVRYAWIEAHRDQYSVSRLCRLLAVSRSGYCQWRGRPPSERTLANAALDARVAAMHAASGRSYGRPRIVEGLRSQGLTVGHERVRKSLHRQGLRPVYKRAYRVTTDSNHRKPIAANVLERRFDGWSVNQAWVADITFVATGEGWLYLAAVMDLSSRRIVGCSMSDRINADLVCSALRSAYWRRKPAGDLIMHTDRGSPYASDRYRNMIKDFRMVQSMSRRANCWDNSPIESFFKTLKVERVYQLRYETRAQARLDLVNWIEGFYNLQRMHSSIGYQTPAAAESSLRAA
ncbi:IS3 family transposase [Steroidobacter denitrificans]|uniref:IS3 family transposase n=1 Tax=Steroidobacter denitrificans TaxID=465721 RepID=UPI0012ED1730|nr:IS3 family transposase [Steroidobacter denitrificans]